MEHQLESLVKIVDRVEDLINAWKGVKTGMNILGSVAKGIFAGIDSLIRPDGVEPDHELADDIMDELIGELHDKLSNLKSDLASATTQEALEIACLLDESGLSDAISEIIDNTDEWTENHSKEELAELNSQLGAIEKKAADSKSKSGKIDIFDEIRTAISAIPIRFAFRNAIMTEDDHNTTSIPWTYTASPATPHYFGVSSVSKYISSLTMVALDEYLSNADDTGLYSLVKGIDDPLNRKKNEKYLIATRNEIKQFQAKDATGEVTFHVWLETAD